MCPHPWHLGPLDWQTGKNIRGLPPGTFCEEGQRPLDDSLSSQSITPAGSAGSEDCAWGPAVSRTTGTDEPAVGGAGLGFSAEARGGTFFVEAPGPGDPA